MKNVQKIRKFIELLTSLFPIWVILSAIIALSFAETINSFDLKRFISWLLCGIMLSMGMTMSIKDFALVLTRPKIIILGVVLRCISMPLLALLVVTIFNIKMSEPLALGLILLGCCPSGTASNILTFIAKGDTALSVTLTSVITIIAPILTPITFYLFIGSKIDVNVFNMFKDILLIVLTPVLTGLLINTFFHSFVEKIKLYLPLIGITCICTIVLIGVSLNGKTLYSVSLIAALIVMTHNILGLFAGYFCSKLFGLSEPQSRALSFEVGTENSGLATTLALTYLEPIAAIVGVIAMVWHNVSGSTLAAFWRRKK